MLKALWRLYLYSATTFSLLFLTFALQNFLDQVFLRVGLTDAATLGGTLDLISQLPPFEDWRYVVGFLAFGVVHWFLIRRDRRNSRGEPTSLIRAYFLSALMSLLGLRVLYALILIVSNTSVLSKTNLPIAAPLAAALAWGLALGLTLAELALGDEFDAVGKTIALCFSLLGQWALAIAAAWAIAQSIQSYLQSIVAPLPQCSPSLDVVTQIATFISRLFQQCTDTAPPIDATLTMLLILATWVVYTRWSAWYPYGIPTIIDAVIGSTIVGVTTLYGAILGIRFALDIFSGQPGVVAPRSLLSTPGIFGLLSYPFVGPFIAGCCLFTIYLRRERSIRNEVDGLAYALVTVTLLLGVVFFTGASWLLGDIFVALLQSIGVVDIGVSAADWCFGLMLFIPGLLGGLSLISPLREILEDKTFRPGTIYVSLFLWGTRAAAAISFLLFLGVIVADYFQIPLDPTNYFSPHLFAITLITTPFAVYYRRLKRLRTRPV